MLIKIFFFKVSQTITRGGPRSQIAIPAQGLVEFRDALTDLLDEFGDSDGGLVDTTILMLARFCKQWGNKGFCRPLFPHPLSVKSGHVICILILLINC